MILFFKKLFATEQNNFIFAPANGEVAQLVRASDS